MRALLFSLLMILAAPFIGMDVALAQGGAELAAARAASASASASTSAKQGASQAPTAPTAHAPSAATKAPEKAPASAPAAAQAPSGEVTDSPALEAHGFSYSPEGRRDPFVSLLRRGTNVDAPGGASTRALGLKGLGTGEVTLKGTMTSRGAYVAILQGADARTYVVRAGEQLLDGTIRSITADGLVILQQVNDPLSKETHREVRKVLRQTEEAR
jgi:type IV pilus assembly protein PilP